MTFIVILAVTIGVVSFGGAAFLLSVWHEDRAAGARGWPISRVIAYLSIAGTLASNFLSVVAVLRVIEFPNFREIQLALTPMTTVALLTLDVLFVVLALYLRAVRATGYITPSERSGLALETSVQEAIVAAHRAYDEANHVNVKLERLTEIVGGKEDRA